MAIPATQMRPGMIIKHNEQLHSVFKVEHRTPGNLRAFIQAKEENARNDKVIPFRSENEVRNTRVQKPARGKRKSG